MAVGERIRTLRRARALSQEALAERVGVSGRHIGHLESGTHQPSLPLLERIAAALGVRAAALLGDGSGEGGEAQALRAEAAVLLDGLELTALRRAVRVLAAMRDPEDGEPPHRPE